MSIKIVEIRKSENTQAEISKSGYNVGKDGREYYIAVFQDTNNPFASLKSRVISQQFNSEGDPIWKSASPQQIKEYIGKEIAGNFITSKVEPYVIGDKTVDTYTCVVLGHENPETVFKQSGHPILDIITGEIKSSSKIINNFAITEKL
jgi:hypothetical protein